MNKLLSITLILCSYSYLFSQIAVINDNDGYTNLRESADSKSKILYKIPDSEVFYFDEFEEEIDWVKIKISKNKFSKTCDFDDTLEGYIHKSRLKQIVDLNKYKAGNVRLKYFIQDFNPTTKIIDYSEGGRWVNKINGKCYYGTDGEMPKKEIKKIEILYNGNKLNVSPSLYDDLFEVSAGYSIYENKGEYIIEQSNSDGAGGYILIWVIGNKGIKQRFIFQP